MAIGLYFTPTGFTAERYDEAIRRLEEAGAGARDGRTCDVALGIDGGIQVLDVWESMEQFEAFGATLVPILTELGVQPDRPTPGTVANVIAG